MNEVLAIDWSTTGDSYALKFRCGHYRQVNAAELERLRRSARAFREFVESLHCEHCHQPEPDKAP